jgi:undecaprenyl-diphosphatase
VRRPVPGGRRPAHFVFELFQAIVLGLLQGLTEFLPVSSSGHLQGVPYLLGWDSGSLTFDVLVHTATLVAVVTYFRHDLWQLASAGLGLGDHDARARRNAWVMIGLLAVGTVPAAFAGVAFSDVFEAAFASPRAVALFLYLTAVLLWTAERIRRRRIEARPQVEARMRREGASELDERPVVEDLLEELPPEPADEAELEDLGAGDPGRDVDTLRVRDVVAIGGAQALAIFPGISRSGATIAMGMALGMSRTAAARFSFLLAVPIILGATLATLPDIGTRPPGTLDFGPVEIAAGMLAAGLSGYWAISTLLAVVQRRDLLGFARYVVVFGTVLLLATFVRA